MTEKKIFLYLLPFSQKQHADLGGQDVSFTKQKTCRIAVCTITYFQTGFDAMLPVALLGRLAVGYALPHPCDEYAGLGL